MGVTVAVDATCIGVLCFTVFLVAIFNIFYGNVDWPHNNCRIWRERKEGAKWRALLYDTDVGFGLNSTSGNTLSWALRDHESTILFRSLLENDTCRYEFFQRMAAHMNTTWHPDRILPILDSLESLIDEHIPQQVEKWNRPYSQNDWDRHVNEVMPHFSRSRIDEARGWCRSYLRADGLYQLKIDIQSDDKGRVEVCEVDVPGG